MTILWSYTLMTAEEAEPLNLLLKICHFFSVVQNSDGFTEHVLCGFCLGAVKSDCCQHLSWDIFSSQWKSEVSSSAVDLCAPKPHYPPPGYEWGHDWVLIIPKFDFITHRVSCWNQIPTIMWGQWGFECRNVPHSPICRMNMLTLSFASAVQKPLLMWLLTVCS